MKHLLTPVLLALAMTAFGQPFNNYRLDTLAFHSQSVGETFQLELCLPLSLPGAAEAVIAQMLEQAAQDEALDAEERAELHEAFRELRED